MKYLLMGFMISLTFGCSTSKKCTDETCETKEKEYKCYDKPSSYQAQERVLRKTEASNPR